MTAQIQTTQDSLAMTKNLGIFSMSLSHSVKHAALVTLNVKLFLHVVVLVILALVGMTQIPHYQKVVMYALKICGVIDHLRVVEVVFPYKSLA